MNIVIITGSSGLVGSEAVDFFCKKNFKVIGIDNNYRKYFFGKDGDTKKIKEYLIKKHKNFYHFNFDIRNQSRIKKLFSKYNKDIKLVIHAAAQPSHDWAKKEPFTDYSINSTGTLNILENMRLFSPKSVFIYLSTNKVYGDNPNKFRFLEKKNRYDIIHSKYKNGFTENLSTDNCIHSLFGASKLSADLIVQEYGKNFGLKTVCFRAGCITGINHAGAKLHGFLSYLVKRSIKKRNYQIIGYKGKQVRDNISSSDLVAAFWEFYKKPKFGEIYNIGGGSFSNCSVLEAIDFVEKKLSIKIKKYYNKRPRVGDHIWYISNNNKFKNDYKSWKQNNNIETIIESIINFELKNNKNL